MVSEAPKKIWISEQLAECRSDCVSDDDIPYIRADLIADLAQVLEGMKPRIAVWDRELIDEEIAKVKGE